MALAAALETPETRSVGRPRAACGKADCREARRRQSDKIHALEAKVAELQRELHPLKVRFTKEVTDHCRTRVSRRRSTPRRLAAGSVRPSQGPLTSSGWPRLRRNPSGG